MSSDAGSEFLDEEIRGEELGPGIDDNALAAAAHAARLPFDRPTEHELAFFPELWESKTAVEVFLLLRNSTLATWQYNPLKECTASDVRNNVFPPFNSDLDLIQNIVHFLTRHGLINFGRYVRSTKISKFLVRDERKVIVIGAGAAGISAATQLISFGYDVVVVEARNRIGGRIHSFKTRTGQLMEAGADTLRKIEDSPITTLLSQVSMEEHGAFDFTTIYVEGRPLNEDKMNMFVQHYKAAKGALNWQSHQQIHREENGRYLSRQQAYENLMNNCERDTLIKYYNYCKSLEAVARARERHFNHLKQLRNTAFIAENQLKKLEEEGRLDEDPILRRSLKRDVAIALEKFEEVADAFETADNHWTKLNAHTQPKQFMHPGADFATYNFMLGMEEYLIGAPLEQVQFSCEGAQNKENGVAARLSEGVAELFNRLVKHRNIDIRLKHRVLDINYSGRNRVKVKIQKDNGDVEEMQAAFVVSTIPIGVLKKTIIAGEGAPTFTPPLPENKVNAIRCIGNGIVNKIIMEFDRAFWASGCRYQFVTVSPNIKTRGSMSLWSSVPDSKVLTGYIVGEAALHNLPEDVVIQNAMQSLQKVFGSQCPRAPISAHLTRWQDDEFAYGSGAYMSLRTESHHFDDMMEPLKTADKSNRVYFAGEHTCSSYTSTIQGAWMSGARAATDLSNDHVGIGFVDLSGGRKDKEEEELIECDIDGRIPEDEEDYNENEGKTIEENYSESLESTVSSTSEFPEAKRARVSDDDRIEAVA